MARARLLKPGFFRNEDLAALPFEARLCYQGLWTIADKQGRLEDRPRRIKPDIFPYDDLDLDALLSQLATAAFIVRYVVDGKPYLAIPTFTLHQHTHVREPESLIPPPPAHLLPRPAASTNLAPTQPGLGDAQHLPDPDQIVGVRCTESESVPESVAEIRSLDPEAPRGGRCTESVPDPESVPEMIRSRRTETESGYGTAHARARGAPPSGGFSEKTRQNLLSMDRLLKRYESGPTRGNS